MVSMLSRRWIIRSLALCAMVLCLAELGTAAGAYNAPSSHSATAPQDTPHVLNYPDFDSGSWPQTFDTANIEDTQSIMAVGMLYANLVKLDSRNRVIPDLAMSWDVSTDGKAYTFHLRTDANFSDGNPITADDVIYSIDRALNPKVLNGKSPSPVGALYLGHILGAASYSGKGDVKGLKKIDAHTVQVTLDSPIAFFLQTLSYPTSDVLEKGKTPIGSLTTNNPLQNQISSGPWMLSAYSYKSSLTFVTNPGYYNAKKMKLRKVVMPFVADANTMYQGYEGDQYAITTVPSARLVSARQQPDFHTSPILAFDNIWYNFAKPPFNNRALRLAANYAINRTLIDNKVMHGLDTPLYSIVPAGIPGYDANGQSNVPGYDPVKARMYLAMAKAQLGKGFPSSLLIHYLSGDPDLVHVYTELQYEWKQIGLNVRVQSIDANSWLSLVTKPTTSLTYTGGDVWVQGEYFDDYPDAQDFATNLLGPTSNYNVGNYGNPEFDRLITEALTTKGSEREQMYVRASRLALNDAAWSMIGQRTTNWRWRPTISGLEVWSGSPNPQPINNDWTKVDVQ